MYNLDFDKAKKKYYKHKLYIPPKEKIIKSIVENFFYFKLVEIISLSDMEIDDHVPVPASNNFNLFF